MLNVSVIIPVYNVSEYIESSIESILNQNNINLEIILIDDCSTDDTLLKIKKMAKLDHRLIIFELKENHGQAYARNVGLDVSRGEYIYFFDADDLLIQNTALDELYNKAQEYNVDCVMFGSRAFGETDLIDAIKDNLYDEEIDEGLYIDSEFFCDFFLSRAFSVAVWRQFWKRSFLINNNISFMEQTSPHEDLLFTFKAFFVSKRIFYMKKIYHLYRVRNNSSSAGDLNIRRFRAYQKIYIESLRYIEESMNRRLNIIRQEALNRYLNTSLMPIYENYARLIIAGEEVLFGNSKNEITKEEFYADRLLMRRFTLLERIITKDEYEILKNAKMVIIYGSGIYGHDIKKMLDDFDITNYLFAVTESKNLDEMSNIADLKNFCNDAVIILGISYKLRSELKEHAKKLGFFRFIELSQF